MRKAIIAAIVATALFAVGAFAASFAVDSEDIASGTDQVTPCADYVEITFEDAVYDTGTQTWRTDEATATFFDEGETAGSYVEATDCDGFDADLALDLDTNLDGAADDSFDYVGAAVPVTATVDGVTATFTIDHDIAEIVGASVAVDDKFIDAEV